MKQAENNSNVMRDTMNRTFYTQSGGLSDSEDNIDVADDPSSVVSIKRRLRAQNVFGSRKDRLSKTVQRGGVLGEYLNQDHVENNINKMRASLTKRTQDKITQNKDSDL